MTDVFAFVDRVFGGSEKTAAGAPLAYVLGLRWVVRSRAEQNELLELENVIARCGIPNLALDKVEPGHNELAFWLHVADPKRAFKALCDVPEIAKRKSTLQAAYAERTKMKFSILWPKGSQVQVPDLLR